MIHILATYRTGEKKLFPQDHVFDWVKNPGIEKYSYVDITPEIMKELKEGTQTRINEILRKLF